MEERDWQKLLAYIEEGQVSPIVGRDLLSVPIDGREMPLYRHLAEQLAERLEVPATDLPDRRELNEVACRFLEKCGKDAVEDVYFQLDRIISGGDPWPIPESLRQLAEITQLGLFVTMTFDPLLARALTEARGGSARVLSYQPADWDDFTADRSSPARPTVYHLAGKVSPIPATYVVTDEDLLRFVSALQDEARRPERLFEELHRRQLLLLGCGYPDWLARFFVWTAAGIQLPGVHTRAGGSLPTYVADPEISSNRDLAAFLKRFGGGRVRLVEGTGAAEFVAELHRRWLAGRTSDAVAEGEPREAADGFSIEKGVVFLSYNSKDQQAAVALSEALEAKGMRVWLDKKALEGGQDFERVIMDSIGTCALFVPIISANCLTGARKFFRKEWTRALEEAEKAGADQTFILPVVVDETSPDEQSLPARIRKLHWTRLTDGPTEEFVKEVRKHYRAYQAIVHRESA